MRSLVSNLLIVVTMMMFTPLVLLGQEQESNQDKFLRYYLLIQEADRMAEAEQYASARKRYQEALRGLETLDPKWEPAIVAYRKRYCADRIRELEGKADKNPGMASNPTDGMIPTPSEPPPEPPKEPAGPDPILENATKTVKFLGEQVKSLEGQLAAAQELLEQEKQKNKDLQNQLLAVQQQLNAAKGENTEAKVAELLKQNEDLKQRLAQADEQIKTLQGADNKASIAFLESQLKAVQEELDHQKVANKSFDEETTSLKKQLSDARKALEDATANASKAINPEQFARENEILRSIIDRQLREEARREGARRLLLDEITSLQIESDTLKERIAILSSPLAELSEEEKRLIRGPSPELNGATNTLVASVNPDKASDNPVIAATEGAPPPVTMVGSVISTDPPSEPAPVVVKESDGTAVTELDGGASAAPAPAMTPLEEAVKTPASEGPLVVTPADEAPAGPTKTLDDGIPAAPPAVAVGSNSPPTEPSAPAVPLTEVASVETKTHPAEAEKPSAPAPDSAGEAEVIKTAAAAPVQDYSKAPRIPDDVRDLAEKAGNLFRMGRYDEAASSYQEMIDKYPDSLYAWSNLGVVRFKEEKLEEAEKALKQAVKLSPNDGFSYSILGIVYYKSARYNEAVNALTRAKTLEPKDAKTRNYLGIACSQLGWQAAAQEELLKAIELEPSFADAHFNLAVIYALQKPPMFELARRHYAQAQQLGVPKDPDLERLLK